MLVPSEDSNMDSERLASARRAEGVGSALPANAATRPAMDDFNMNPLCLATLVITMLDMCTPLRDMAEDAPFALYPCVQRHITIERCYG
jgi:hypothetical protein